MNAAWMRTLLFVDIIAMALLAFFYLRGRELAWHEYLSFGLIALFVPLLGPFLVILTRPGKPVHNPKPLIPKSLSSKLLSFKQKKDPTA